MPSLSSPTSFRLSSYPLLTLPEKMASRSAKKKLYSNAEWHVKKALEILSHGLAALDPVQHVQAYIFLSKVVRLRDMGEAVQCLLAAQTILATAEPARLLTFGRSWRICMQTMG